MHESELFPRLSAIPMPLELQPIYSEVLRSQASGNEMRAYRLASSLLEACLRLGIATNEPMVHIDVRI